MTSTDTSKSAAPSCPVLNFDYTELKPAGTWFEKWAETGQEYPYFLNQFGQGFWTVANYQGALEVLQDPHTFSSSAIYVQDPNPVYKWIPEMLDGDEHRRWRQLLAPHFSPSAVQRMAERIRERARGLVESLAERGSCDFMADFAQLYPTSIFLELIGLPVEELPQFMEWEHAALHGGQSDDNDAMISAMMMVAERFNALIAERRAEPRDDLFSKAIGFEIDGRPVTDEELCSFGLLMFLAGLDTVSVTLGWAFRHLAMNPDDRDRLVSDPGLIPNAIEEFMRAYAIVIPGRKVAVDTEFHGCPMKAGDMVSVPLAAAMRDPEAFPDASTIDITRTRNNHIAFGAGPHRCLGSHLARLELKIALEEWHRLIPDYAIPADANLLETGLTIGLETLPLEWNR
ncbi:Camphor 5-monooxygenase [Mycolicibacterium vanbaalenii]|uniref:Camphor 5-monooxygenase n=2 Tax=Mycolicibacterium vanbaalenii TaxID=110539 RepID=A0A5S9RBR3_MYCVN|nr:Camphor 5-monooxygenase [Mycolicibacterium vanbaalenii]